MKSVVICLALFLILFIVANSFTDVTELSRSPSLALRLASMSYYNTKNTTEHFGARRRIAPQSEGERMNSVGLHSNPNEFDIKESHIQGVGLFSNKNYGVDEPLLKAIENDKSTVTEYGSKINHCSKPHIVNTYLKEMENGEWTLFSKKNILVGEELTCDYNNTPDFIDKPDKSWTC